MKRAVGTGWNAYNTFSEETDWMNIIYADYNIYHNSIDICTYAGYILRIDCAKSGEGLKTTPNSEFALNALALDNPLEYARLYLVELCRYGLIRRIH